MESSRSGKPIKILIGVLHTHERNGWICGYLAQWLTDLPNIVGEEYQFIVTYLRNFIPAASGRNYFCRTMKDSDPRPDWLLMIDNDMAPPINLLDSVKNAPEDAMVVVPQFQMWDEAKPSVTLCWGMEEHIAPKMNEKQIFELEYGKFYPLTKCGTGAIFIRPELFDKISMPYFWYTWNADQGLESTEDINFSKKVINSGYKIYGNSSISVGHYHNVNLDVLAKRYIPRPIDKVTKPCNKGIIGSECPSDPASPAVSR